MQNFNIERDMINASSGRFKRKHAFSKRIGSTIYQVNVYPGEGASEPLEKKLLRMMKNDLESHLSYVNMNVPQADWLPGRSSV